LISADLAYTLHTGKDPLFAQSWSLHQFKTRTPTPPNSSDQYNLDGGSNCHLQLHSSIFPHSHRCVSDTLEHLFIDLRVVSIFSDLQQVSDEINHQRRLQDSRSQLALCSIQYRLLTLRGVPVDTFSECLRLGMLVFLTTTFEIPEAPGQRFPCLAQRFRDSCSAVLLEDPHSETFNALSMWLLVIGGVSLFGLGDDWLRECWRKVVPGFITWYEARNNLRKILWIDALHDKLGKEMFDAFTRNDVGDAMAHKTKTSAWWLSGWGMCPLES
jgi:hypothetical protein